MRHRTTVGAILVILATSFALGQTTGAPETFVAMAQAANSQGAAVTGTVTIQINKYTTDQDRTRIQDALRIGGYPGFLPELRKAPEVGYVELNGKKTSVRWARQQPSDKGRTIAIVTDTPIFFVGGGAVDAKPRAGFDVAVIQIDVDSVGIGTGTMAAAARVRPGGATGVQIDDYAETPIKLTSVRKSFK
jgi:hypothetical protein